ncbi:MBL fold metallo-hydrolase [Alteribacter populi]|uniref:MBL fold metallo-hydrolase n=1 Tax=Alteribacter populi TaxID=2011011 RepID=UPI000BBA90A6|nr:MBL fold metallo-hydrolase [Alteribacter populi]
MKEEMSHSKDNKYIPALTVTSGSGKEVASDLYCYTVGIVNVCFFGESDNSDEWILIDAGMPKSAENIITKTEERFGSGSRPKAIVLTHGHFDHIGSVIELVKHWNVPVFAHELELPYLTGKERYPQPDSSVEGGFLAKISPLFPNEPIDLGSHVQRLPSDQSVPGMPGWRWIHTPGHTPGHVSFFREADRLLIAGDAFITVKQDSLFKVLTQKQEINGPPRYFTPDWKAAWESVNALEKLKPEIAVTGHGLPVSGEALKEGLEKLANEFDRLAIPDYGTYVEGKLH